MFKIYFDLSLKIVSILRMCHELLGRMFILQLLDGKFCRYHLCILGLGIIYVLYVLVDFCIVVYYCKWGIEFSNILNCSFLWLFLSCRKVFFFQVNLWRTCTHKFISKQRWLQGQNQITFWDERLSCNPEVISIFYKQP